MKKINIEIIEQELNLEFINEILETQKENTINVKDFNLHYK